MSAHKKGQLWKFDLNEINEWVKSAKADKSENKASRRLWN